MVSRTFGSIAVSLITVLSLAILVLGCSTLNVGSTAEPDRDLNPAPGSGTGVVHGTLSSSPVIGALIAEMGIADIDDTDTATLATSIAAAALVAFDLAEIANGGSPDAEAILAAAQAAGVPILF